MFVTDTQSLTRQLGGKVGAINAPPPSKLRVFIRMLCSHILSDLFILCNKLSPMIPVIFSTLHKTKCRFTNYHAGA